MKSLTTRKLIAPTVALAMVSTFGLTTVASAVAMPKTSVDMTATNTLIAQGDTRITKRLTDLDALNAKLTATTKLSADNKSSLQGEIDNTKNGLTQLKTKLDADTTQQAARADSASVLTDYRVYMVVAPKVRWVKVADNQLNNEAKLLVFASALQTKADASKDSANLSPRATALTKKITDNQTTTQAAETTILALKPTDYNANHAVLKTQSAQLKAIHTSNVAAYNEGKAIAKALGYKL